MNTEQIRDIYSRAFRISWQLGFNFEQSEEIAQEVLCLMLESKIKKATVKQAVITAIRSIYGDARRQCHSIEVAQRYARLYDPRKDKREDDFHEDFTIDDAIDFEKKYNRLSERHKLYAILILRGLNRRDISKALKLSYTNTCIGINRFLRLMRQL